VGLLFAPLGNGIWAVMSWLALAHHSEWRLVEIDTTPRKDTLGSSSILFATREQRLPIFSGALSGNQMVRSVPNGSIQLILETSKFLKICRQADTSPALHSN